VKTIVGVVVGAVLSGMLALLLFYLVTNVLVDSYTAVTGKLIHHGALLHVVSQGSVLGGLGGVLYVLQLLTSRDSVEVLGPDFRTALILSAINPVKGLIAGLIAALIAGGLLLMLGDIELLRKSHLFVIGCSCIAGYSEQFLQRVVNLASSRLPKSASSTDTDAKCGVNSANRNELHIYA
jgi:hypothetical protein